MDEASRVKWLVAAHVSRAARELARERGIEAEELSEATMMTLQDLALLCYGEGQLMRPPPAGAFEQPTGQLDRSKEVTRRSRRPTRPAPK